LTTRGGEATIQRYIGDRRSLAQRQVQPERETRAPRMIMMRTGQKGAQVPQVALLLETSTEYGRGLLRGILRFSRLHGPWSLCVAPGHFDQALPKAKSWKGTGIIARISSREMEARIKSTGLPFVASSLFESRALLQAGPYGEIRTNSVEIGRMGAHHLLDAGLRHFAFCGFGACNWSAAREISFCETLKARSRDCSIHHITSANWRQRRDWLKRWERERPIMASWLKSLPKPVGVMACNDACGRDVLQVCASEGLRIPDDVAVIGVDNDEMLCELSNPPLSSVALDLDKAGYEAARLLNDLMSSAKNGKGRLVQVQPTGVVTRRSSDVNVADDVLVAAALSFIRDHIKQTLSVDQIAEELRVSRRTIERRFQHSVGRTILSEVTRCHLRRAKQLLAETDLPCHAIAVESGFGSLKSFTRSFKQNEGTTPHELRVRRVL
jgi:LacI family transcriptional regulator